MTLSDGSGRLVQLSDIAEIRPGSGPTKVEHVDLDRAIKLNVNMQETLPLEEAVRLVEQTAVAGVRQTLPLGYSIDISGQARVAVPVPRADGQRQPLPSHARFWHERHQEPVRDAIH